MRIALAAYGLSRDLTGIERIVCEVSAELIREGAQVVVLADAGARWPSALTSSCELERVARPALGVAASRPAAIACRTATVLHSFGARVPANSRGIASYTVHDWGMLTDSTMPWRARAAWSAAVWGSAPISRAVHVTTAHLVDAAPKLLRRRIRRWIVSTPSVDINRNIVPRPERVIPSDYLLFVGSDIPRKQLDYVVHAVRDSRSDLQLVCAGPGTEKRSDGDRVVGIGHVDDETLAALYQGCTATVLVSSYEGYGLPAVEAALYGRPSIVSAEVAAIHQGRLAGYLLTVDPSNPTEILAAARRARGLSLPPLPSRRELSELARFLLEQPA